MAKDLDDTLKFLDTKLRENYSQVLEVDLLIREMKKKMEALERELAQIKGPAKKIKRTIIVELEVSKAGTLDLNVSYLVRGASWQPIYDARASFEKSEVELVSYGIVRQSTGEDWNDVEIALSTAKPSIGGRMPYVEPWFLRIYQPQRAMKEWRISNNMALTEQYAAFTPVKDKGIGGVEVEYATAEEKGIAVVYKLPRKGTVKADGSEHKLPVSTQTLTAKFQYSTYPRVAPYAYLGSRVTNAKDLQLLAGRVNIFLEGDFVGTSSIDNIGPQEEFDLYLGVDENVKVKRELMEKEG